MAILIAYRDCAAIQRLPPPPKPGRLECRRCGRVLESTVGRSLDAALACSVATLLLLFPATFLSGLTVHIAGVTQSTRLFSGILELWREGWPLTAVALGLFGIALPFARFALLSATLAAIRSGVRGPWVGAAFRHCETLDLWAMSDVLLIGAGIGYGWVASQTRVDVDAGGWCLVAAAMMTMLTRATLERRAVWRRLETPPSEARPDSVACTGCELVVPPELEGRRCPRCAAPIHRRRPRALARCAALTAATWVLAPIAYGYPMSQFWRAGVPTSHTVIDGVLLLFQNGFWFFEVVIFLVSVVFPFTKLVGLTWFLLSIRRGWSGRPRLKAELYRFVDDVGRWSVLDPFTVMVFTPMVQLGQLGHFTTMGGAEAFLATVVLSMLAARALDPRLIWDVATPGAVASAGPPAARAAGTRVGRRGARPGRRLPGFVTR